MLHPNKKEDHEKETKPGVRIRAATGATGCLGDVRGYSGTLPDQRAHMDKAPGKVSSQQTIPKVTKYVEENF